MLRSADGRPEHFEVPGRVGLLLGGAAAEPCCAGTYTLMICKVTNAVLYWGEFVLNAKLLQGVSEVNITTLRACTASVCSLLSQGIEEHSASSDVVWICVHRVAHILRHPHLSHLHTEVSASLHDVAVAACHAIDAPQHGSPSKYLIMSLMAVVRASDTPMLLVSDAVHLWNKVLVAKTTSIADKDTISYVTSSVADDMTVCFLKLSHVSWYTVSTIPANLADLQFPAGCPDNSFRCCSACAWTRFVPQIHVPEFPKRRGFQLRATLPQHLNA